jgi:hypothetical protein
MRQSGWMKEKGIIPFLFLFSLIASVKALDIVDAVQTYSSLSATTVNMSGVSELHITASTAPITGCTINLNSTDSFFFLEQIIPSVVQSTYLSQIYVNGAAAVLNTNVRIVEYVSGSVVIPHSSSFQPLTVYSGYFYTGTSQALSQYTYYKGSASLGTLNNNISSFKLKRGYEATFAQDEFGSGLSKTYVAQDTDINIAIMPSELDNSISFVRVFPWRWTSKKGWSGTSPGGATDSVTMKCFWRYDWDNGVSSTQDIEYVPMRSKSNWPDYANINNKQNSMHVLGFNEPDKADQANMTVTDAIAQWPELMASGLRLGAPASSDASTGLDWVYNFIDRADALNYRVDYVAVHYYKGGWTASQLYNWLKGIYDRTRRPIWVTEWNNGANWTTPTPTLAENATAINSFMDIMNNAFFVERYSIFQWVGDTRMMIDATTGIPTPAGVVYRDKVVPIAHIQPPADGSGGCAYYPFNGNTKDSLFYANHGFAKNGPTYTTGHSGQALDFDGTDDYVLLPERIGDSENFTFAAWVYWDVNSQNQRIFDFGNGTTYNMFLTPRSGANQLRFAITTTSYTSEQALVYTQLSTSAWVHVAVTINGNTGKLFVNGALVNTNTSMTINPSDLKTKKNYLGKSQYDDPYFNGRLDDVHIADFALTDSQIAALAAGTQGNMAPVFTSNPITRPEILYGISYTSSLVYNASDFDTTQALIFTKNSGPAWLSVASDGTISGTPSASDIGINSFSVRVTDSAGAYSDATLNITVADYGLKTHYKFDGNANDSVGTKHGIATGSPAYTTGKFGQAVTLDSIDDVITLPAGIANSDDITIATWVYWNGGSNWQRIFDFGTGTSQYMFLTPSTGSVLRFAIKNGGSEQTVQASSALAAGAWVHLAVTLSGNTATLYVNGAIAGTNPSLTINPNDFSSVINYIGDSQFSGDPLFSGLIDDFRIYNYGLSAVQIAALYAGNTAPVFTSDPINNVGAVELESYLGTSLATYANDVDGMNTLTFSKISGPDWLAVAADGTLSGVPGNSNVGANVFTVKVLDNGGLSDTATMNITVANIYSGTAGLDDLMGLASQWLISGCTDTPACQGADLDGDLDVDMEDFAELAFGWLLSENLQLYLKLDETSGTTAQDDSIYNRPGVLNNGPSWSTAGKYGNALSFDGTDDYVDITGYQGITGTASRTCCAWIKTTAVGQGNILSWGADQAGQKWIFRAESSGVLSAAVYGGYVSTTAAINDGQWHHVAAVLNDDGSPSVNEVLLYIDGVLQSTSASNGQSIGTVASQNVILGAIKIAGVTSAYLNGLLDDVRIYNRALTASEIAALAQ